MINFLKKLLTPIRYGVVMDDKMQFADALNLAASAVDLNDGVLAKNYCSAILDFGVSSPNVGSGSPLWLTIQLVTSTGAGTVSVSSFLGFELQHAADGSVYTGLMASPLFHISTDAKAGAAGFVFVNQPLPAYAKRYMRLARIALGTAISIGTFDAFIHLGGIPGTAYQIGING